MVDDNRENEDLSDSLGGKGSTQPTIYYCYDALCGWCYGFSSVIKKLADEYKGKLAFDVLSGGMVMPDYARPISVIAKYIGETYRSVERRSGIEFGEDYLWHVFNPEKSDWVLSSEKPAIALSIFKDYHPERAVQMAADLQYAHMYEGRDLTDDEAYRHLLPVYGIIEEEFYIKLKSKEYLDKAHNDFDLVKELQVTGYPTVLMQVSESKFYLLARGYTDYETMKQRIDKMLEELNEGKAI